MQIAAFDSSQGLTAPQLQKVGPTGACRTLLCSTVPTNIITAPQFGIILITIYLHSEYLSWSEISGNSKFITSSYIIKNLVILVSLISLYLYLRKPSKKIYPKVKGEEKIYTKNTNEDYFDKFRNKEKLKTKAEQILEKDGKD